MATLLRARIKEFRERPWRTNRLSQQEGRLRWLAGLAGIDRAVFFTIANRSWSIVAGPISILLVIHFLTPDEQGFYYTFSSLIALQVFFELGLAYVLMQCVSHEKAGLEWGEGGTLQGDPIAKARLASLLRFATKWYGAVALLALCIVAPAGLFFFQHNQPQDAAVQWRLPWLMMVAMAAANLALTPFYAVLEGCGKVADYARMTVRQAVYGSLLFWGALASNGRLFAAPVVSFVSFLVGTLWLFGPNRPLFRDLIATPVPAAGRVNWRREILPFQWKIALSWLSGYFIFQLANPIMFRYHGAAAAGRMGMSLRIVDTITTLAFSWVSTKAAPFGTYIARREFATLDRLFWRAAVQAAVVLFLAGAALVMGALLLAALGSRYSERLLDPVSLALLVLNALVNCIIFSLAVYLRGHKKEPFLWLSIAGAFLAPVVMLLLAPRYDGFGIAAGLLMLNTVVGLPAATWIFARKRREWHT